MAGITKKGKVWVIRLSINSTRKIIYTGLKNESVARRLAEKVEQLKTSVLAGADLSPELITWIGRLEVENAEIYEKLVSLGLLQGKKRKATLADVLEFYEKKGESKSARTLYTYEKTGRYLVQYFGAEKPVEDITVRDAERFVKWFKTEPLNLRGKIAKPYSEAKINREMKNFKAVFQLAEDMDVIDKSPFRLLQGGACVNPATLEYVPAETVMQIIEHCENPKWRAIFALGRFAGARGASDFSVLTWDKIHWTTDAEPGFIILEGKTSGMIPMNAVLEACLAELFTMRDKDEAKVFPDVTANTNVNTVVKKHIAAAGFELWQKPWYNLRKSFCTDVMNSGVDLDTYRRIARHSVKVAMEHYQIYHAQRHVQAVEQLKRCDFMKLQPSTAQPGPNFPPPGQLNACKIKTPVPSRETGYIPPILLVHKKVHTGYTNGYTQGIAATGREEHKSRQTPENTAQSPLPAHKRSDLQIAANRFDRPGGIDRWDGKCRKL